MVGESKEDAHQVPQEHLGHICLITGPRPSEAAPGLKKDIFNHRGIESFRLENTFKFMESNHKDWCPLRFLRGPAES